MVTFDHRILFITYDINRKVKKKDVKKYIVHYAQYTYENLYI